MSRSAGSSWLDRIFVSICLSSLLIGSDARASRFFPIASSLGGTRSVDVHRGANGTGGLGPTALLEEEEEEEDEEEQPGNGTMRCDDARLKCAYRTGCGHALQHYLTGCASVLQGDVNDCPEMCQHALIGLMSSDEGKELMTCECAKDDAMCRQSKQRVEICRASVTATMNRTTVSCRVATWICNADALCSTALRYYNDYCKRMFHGKKCTKRCRNSINILRRQEKAARLNTCFCDGAEEYDCIAIHRNMDELCFNKPAQHHNYQEQQLGTSGSSTGYSGSGDPRTNRIPANRAKVSSSASWRILLLGLVLLLPFVAT